MKYRRLQLEELEELKDEFVQFLAANSVTADEWESLKQSSPDKVDQLIDLFSDIFWDKALGNIQCTEQRTPRKMRVIRFEETKAHLIELRLGENAKLDLTKSEDLNNVIAGKVDPNRDNPELFTGTKDYQTDRKLEIFQLIEKGAVPCKLVVWEAIRRMVRR